MIQKWNNVEGVLIINFYKDPFQGWLIEGDENIRKLSYEVSKTRLYSYFNKMTYPSYEDACNDLIIKFKSSGYYDPGSRYGGPDHLGWPPECDDERLIVSIEIDESDIELDYKTQDELFEIFIDQIYEAELNE